MCYQYFNTYELCPCQQRADFVECEKGPLSPSCNGHKVLISETNKLYCTYHERQDKTADNDRVAFFTARRRRLWNIPKSTPASGRRIGGCPLRTNGAWDLERFGNIDADGLDGFDSGNEGPEDDRHWGSDDPKQDEELKLSKSRYFKAFWGGQRYWAFIDRRNTSVGSTTAPVSALPVPFTAQAPPSPASQPSTPPSGSEMDELEASMTSESFSQGSLSGSDGE